MSGKIYYDIEQGTDEWFALRLGKATGSKISDIVTRTKTGWGATRGNYMALLIAERLTGQPGEHYQSFEMKRGNEVEPQARAAYGFYTGYDVAQAGFIDHPTIPMSGFSPDGLVGDDGLVEFKCPNTMTHIDSLLGGIIKKSYRYQVQWGFACTGRNWCDWVSFDPRLPEEMRLHVEHITRDQDVIDELEREVPIFLGELEERLAQLNERYPSLEAA